MISADFRRKLGLVASALVIGVMLAVGTVLYGEGLSAAVVSQADVRLVAYRKGVEQSTRYQRRFLRARDSRTRASAELDRPRYTRAYYRTEVGEPDPQAILYEYPGAEECKHRAKIADDLEAIVVPLIPGNFRNQQQRQEIIKAFASYRAACDTPPADAAEPEVEFLEGEEGACNKLLTVVQRRLCRIRLRQR